MVTFDYKKTPITQVADYIIMYAAKSGASDIHFDPKENGLMVRIRIDGQLQDYTLIPKEYERNLTTRLKLLANMNITESRLPQDGAIKRQFGNLFLDMRASSLPTNEGEKIVVRILDYSRSLQGLEHLGFSHTNFLKLKRMIEVPNGIILVTGATGTGKSTTTYSILQALNKPETNIITVEDPIEMNIEGLNQVQVNSEIGLDFATVLRSILRQDPNIILIGEIRDSETAKIAVRASITGHLVLSTIHTNDSLSTIERLLDMDVERYLLSSALTGIISQRLAKMICPKCRIKRPATSYEKKVFKRALGKKIEEIYDANHDGCSNCNHGYKGRIAVQEVLEIDNDIRDALNDEDLEREDLRKMVYTSNVITLLQDGLEKVLNGVTSFEEIYRIIEIEDDKNENYNQELSDVKKEQQQLKKQEQLSEKTSTEVKKAEEITTKTTLHENQTEKPDKEETASTKKEATQVESIMNQPKQQEEKNDIVLSIPEVPVFPEPEINPPPNHTPLEIPSGNMIEEKQETNPPLETTPTMLNQETLEIPTGSLDIPEENPTTIQNQENKEFTTLDSLKPSNPTEEDLEQKENIEISFSNNFGEIPKINQEKTNDSNKIEFSSHVEDKKEDTPNDGSTNTNNNSLENTVQEDQVPQNLEEQPLNDDSTNTDNHSLENTVQEDQVPQNLEEQSLNDDSTNSNNHSLESTVQEDQNNINKENSHLEPSINLLSDVPSNYSQDSTKDQKDSINETESNQQQTVEQISINPRMDPQLIEQSTPLTPTVTENE